MAKKTLPCGDLKNIRPTAAIRMENGHVVQSSWDCEVEVPMASSSIAHRFYVMDTDAVDFVLGTDFLVRTPRLYPSPCKHPTSLKWTMVADGNLYLWSNLNTHLAT